MIGRTENISLWLRSLATKKKKTVAKMFSLIQFSTTTNQIKIIPCCFPYQKVMMKGCVVVHLLLLLLLLLWFSTRQDQGVGSISLICWWLLCPNSLKKISLINCNLSLRLLNNFRLLASTWALWDLVQLLDRYPPPVFCIPFFTLYNSVSQLACHHFFPDVLSNLKM